MKIYRRWFYDFKLIGEITSRNITGLLDGIHQADTVMERYTNAGGLIIVAVLFLVVAALSEWVLWH